METSEQVRYILQSLVDGNRSIDEVTRKICKMIREAEDKGLFCGITESTGRIRDRIKKISKE